MRCRPLLMVFLVICTGNGESHTIHLGTKYDADETVGNLLWVARDPAVQDPTAEQQQADAGAGAGGVAAPLE